MFIPLLCSLCYRLPVPAGREADEGRNRCTLGNSRRDDVLYDSFLGTAFQSLILYNTEGWINIPHAHTSHKHTSHTHFHTYITHPHKPKRTFVFALWKTIRFHPRNLRRFNPNFILDQILSVTCKLSVYEMGIFTHTLPEYIRAPDYSFYIYYHTSITRIRCVPCYLLPTPSTPPAFSSLNL